MLRTDIRGLALCSFLFLIDPGALQAQPARVEILRWTAVVADAEVLVPRPRAYRLFQTSEQISLILTVVNGSATVLILDIEDFQRTARVSARVNSTNESAVQIHWEPSIRRSGESFATNVSPQDQVRIEASGGFEWTLGVRLADGRPFTPGDYQFDISLGDAFRSLRSIEGTPWNGQVLSSTTLDVIVAPATTATDRAARYRVLAMAAMAENRAVDAVNFFTLALVATPNDPDLAAGLGNAYLNLNRYREAIAAYEVALPGALGRHSGVPNLLALAYVATGDEPNAARILSLTGRTDADVSAEVRSLREQAQRRGPRR
jgi:hypothetical protein